MDTMTSVTGLDFETAWDRKIDVDFSGVQAPVLCRADILAAQVASGRARGETLVTFAATKRRS